MERLAMGKSRPLKGEMQVPGDKSITHRAIIFGAISEGETRVNGFLSAQDCLRTLAAFQGLGVEIRREKESLNISGVGIQGPPLSAIHYNMPIPSAQVKSALLLAGLYANGKTTIHEPAKSRDHTERLLRFLGVEVEEQGLAVSVKGPAVLQGREVQVPGDLSSAAFFIVAASVVKGSQVVIL